jgi:ABC-type amino acid transport substrate-binding protein
MAMTRRGVERRHLHRLAIAVGACALLATAPWAGVHAAPAGTLERIRDTGKIRLGYRADARPFSYTDEGGNAAGYSIALCQHIADTVKRELQLRALAIDWIVVPAPDRFRAAQQGAIDVLCGADTVTLDRRALVAFSTPIFPGGIAVLVRSDAPFGLRDVLSGKSQSFRPIWRANASQALKAKAFAAVSGTTAETWLTERINDLKITTTVSSATTYDMGVWALRTRQIDALFGERAILLDAARRAAAAHDLAVLDRLFTYEPLALAMTSGDEALRLAVDRSLTELSATGELLKLYTKWFGEPDESTVAFFRWNRLSN